MKGEISSTSSRPRQPPGFLIHVKPRFSGGSSCSSVHWQLSSLPSPPSAAERHRPSLSSSPSPPAPWAEASSPWAAASRVSPRKRSPASALPRSPPPASWRASTDWNRARPISPCSIRRIPRWRGKARPPTRSSTGTCAAWASCTCRPPSPTPSSPRHPHLQGSQGQDHQRGRSRRHHASRLLPLGRSQRA